MFNLFQHRIEKDHQLIKLNGSMIRWYARIHPAFRNRSDGRNEAAKRTKSAMRQQRSAGNPKHNDREHKAQECLAEPLQKSRLFSFSFADLKRQSAVQSR